MRLKQCVLLSIVKKLNKGWMIYYVIRINVYENGVEIAVINVLSNEDVLQKTYFDVINDIGRNWAII